MIAQEEGTVMGAALRQTPPVKTYPILGLYCKTSPPMRWFNAIEIWGAVQLDLLKSKNYVWEFFDQNSGQRKTHPPLPPERVGPNSDLYSFIRNKKAV